MRTMYDSVVSNDLPDGGDLYAAYVDGEFENFGSVQSRFPNKTVVGIATSADTNNGVVVDVESGDASPDDAPSWVQMRRSYGIDPTVYCSESNWATVQRAFVAAGVQQPNYWVAAYPGAGSGVPAGAVAHQWEDVGPYDVSSVVDYWPGVDAAPAPPTPTTFGGSTMDCDVPGGGVLACRSDGGVFAWEGANFYGSLPALGVTPSAPIVGIASTSTSKGYWLVGSDGMVYCFGDAQYYGPLPKYASEWGIVGKVTGIVRGNAAGAAYTIAADLGGSAPSLYGITTNGQYKS